MLSILELVRRAYSPKDFLVGVDEGGEPHIHGGRLPAPEPAGLLVFRFDAELFFANASLFVDDIRALIVGGSDARALARPRLLLASATSTTRRASTSPTSSPRSTPRVAYSPWRRSIRCSWTALRDYGTLEDFDNSRIYPTVLDALEAFRADAATTT